MAEVYTECGYHIDVLISAQRANWVIDQVDQEDLYCSVHTSFMNKLEAEIIQFQLDCHSVVPHLKEMHLNEERKVKNMQGGRH
jgi:hypothetical protein